MKFLPPATWSVRALLPAFSRTSTTAPPVSPATIAHLHRLSALPVPVSNDKEAAVELGDHLRFVQGLGSLDTRGVEPLSAVRDEVCTGEVRVGDLQGGEGVAKEQGRVDVMGLAKRREGVFFVVDGIGREE